MTVIPPNPNEPYVLHVLIRAISLIQKFPSYLFQVGQTQIATDKEIANDIYVRLTR